jgi:hypothetical protein
MVPLQRFTAVLDACTMYPMLVRDVLLTFASHEFFTPKWSPRIRDEWTRNLEERLKVKSTLASPAEQVAKIAAAISAAFPDGEITREVPETSLFDPVDPKDRHVAMTALVASADAIITFNTADFEAEYLYAQFQIEVIHPDDFVMDLISLNEKRAVAAFRELRVRKKNPPWDVPELVRRLSEAGLTQTSLWVRNPDVGALI